MFLRNFAVGRIQIEPGFEAAGRGGVGAAIDGDGDSLQPKNRTRSRIIKQGNNNSPSNQI
jgi:hypothetical protein